MMGVVARERGDGADGWYLRGDDLDTDAFVRDAARATRGRRSPCASRRRRSRSSRCSTRSPSADAVLALPAGSRIMETGGFKGRSRVVERATLYAQASQRLGVPVDAIVAEYGMTELSSQYYDAFASRVAGRAAREGRAAVAAADRRRRRRPPAAARRRRRDPARRPREPRLGDRGGDRRPRRAGRPFDGLTGRPGWCCSAARKAPSCAAARSTRRRCSRAVADDAAHGSLRALPARRIVAHVADAAERWSDADFPPRVRAALAIEARLGYSAPVVDYALDRLFFGVTRAALEAAIACGARQRRSARRDRRAARRARGVGARRRPRRDRVERHDDRRRDRARAVRAVREVRRRREGPQRRARRGLLRLARRGASGVRVRGARARVDRRRRSRRNRSCSSAPTRWSRSGATRRCARFARAAAPDTRFIGFGHRASIGRLTRDDAAALDGALAERIARDALLYDGEGCLSLHALFVHGDAPALARVAQVLAAACERVAIEFPGGVRSAARAPPPSRRTATSRLFARRAGAARSSAPATPR